MEAAVEAVIKGECTFHNAQEIYGVKRTTLRRQLQIWKSSVQESSSSDTRTYTYTLKLDHKKIFTDEEKKRLVTYAVTLCKMNYRLSVKEFREQAYKFAVALGKTLQPKWTEKKLQEKSGNGIPNYHNGNQSQRV